MEAQTTVNFFSLDVFSPLACLSIVAERALASLPSDTAAQGNTGTAVSHKRLGSWDEGHLLDKVGSNNPSARPAKKACIQEPLVSHSSNQPEVSLVGWTAEDKDASDSEADSCSSERTGAPWDGAPDCSAASDEEELESRFSFPILSAPVRHDQQGAWPYMQQ